MVRNVISFELRGASQPSVSWYQRSKVTSSSSSYSSSSDLLLTLSQEFNRWPAEEVEFNVKEINWSLPLRLMMFGRWSKKILIFFVVVFLEMVISQFVVDKSNPFVCSNNCFIWNTNSAKPRMEFVLSVLALPGFYLLLLFVFCPV